MRNVIMGLVFSVISIFAILISTSITKQSVLYNEEKRAITSAITGAMEELELVPKYEITSNDEFVGEFIRQLASNIDSSAENIKVNVLEADYKQGLLDVMVTYKGQTKKDISVRKTIIVN